MDNRKISLSIYGNKIYILIISLLIIILFFYDFKVASILLGLFVVLIYFNVLSTGKKQQEIEKYLQTLSFDIDQTNKDTLLHFPLPITIVTFEGRIKWYNQSFTELFEEKTLVGRKIQDIVTDFKEENLIKDINQFIIPAEYKSKHYEIVGNNVNMEGTNKAFTILYWFNKTDLNDLKKEYDDSKNIVAIVMVDNYEEVIQSTEDKDRSKVTTEINQILVNWAGGLKGILKNYERDKYICIFAKKYMEYFNEKKFEILKSVKEISKGNSVPLTLSIGIGIDGKEYQDNEKYAKSAIDIALGRGGDQIVINDGKRIKYYGGNTQEFEKRTKVKARVVAYALRELIAQCSEVIIMGHINPDVDSIGASLGLSRVAKEYKKDCHIVLDDNNSLVKNLLKKFEDNQEYTHLFITKNAVMNIVNSKSLLIVLDTHKVTQTICPDIIDIVGQVVVIDHHRRGEEFIENAVLSYHEPYASSTCELVTEIIQYIDKNQILNSLEAEALYTGIVMDTKNFTFKTGVRTFEAAGYLRRVGVNISEVKKIFKDSKEAYIMKLELIKNAVEYKDNIYITSGNYNLENVQQIISQTADELLNIKGISASFVLCERNGNIYISARSLEDINVQMILEKLGGGGHLNLAGAMLPDTNMNRALIELKEAIDEYLLDSDKEKINTIKE
jgi:c-di-AMP phosphodiesterase-like protein